MHSPRPFGRRAIGGELTDDDAAAVELLARKLTNFKAASGLESLRMVRALPDGGYAVAQDMGGVFSITSYKAAEEKPQAFDGLAKDSVPTLFSGVITRDRVAGDEGVKIKLTEAARRRLANYSKEPKAYPQKEVELQRFRVGYSAIVEEFIPKYATAYLHTQYTNQRPTWYSGAMAEVMQIVGGYGRQDLGRLPRTFPEQATLALPEKVKAAIRQELGNVRLPGYSGFPPADGKFQYDYKFHNTHAVGFDAERKPWLICVRTDGVWAVPLPMVPATTTKAFREYVQEVGDEELLAILDRFGGMPSGEPFPSRYLLAWKRAGVAIKVSDMSDFYSHLAYTTACGWSFNLDGSEGFNTCYNHDLQEGLSYGLAYKMKLRLQPAKGDGKLPPFDFADMTPDTARRLDSYLAAIYERLDNSRGDHLAIKYKLRRAEPAEILSRAADAKSVAAEIEYWDALEMPPIAGHTGSVSRVGRGWLYHHGNFRTMAQMKFPEPHLGGCVSFDFAPFKAFVNAHKSPPRCDTIMFGYYIGDELKVVRYFYDRRPFKIKEESDFEDCMIVGSWTKTRTFGDAHLEGNFYTSDFDARQQLAEVVETTRVVGRDLGYDSKPWFSSDYVFSMTGSLWRNRYFSTETETETTEGRSHTVAACVPFHNRNALIYATKSGQSGSSYNKGSEINSIRDPNMYRFWSYHDLFYWWGGSEGMPGTRPDNGSPVWVGRYLFADGPCSDFSNGGDWISGLPQDYTWLIHPDAGYHFSGGGGPPKFNPVQTSRTGKSSEWGNLSVSVLESGALVHSKVPWIEYFRGVPNDLNRVLYVSCAKVVFGSVTYASASERADGSMQGPFRYWGGTALADHMSTHHFIGVINE